MSQEKLIQKIITEVCGLKDEVFGGFFNTQELREYNSHKPFLKDY